MKNISSLIFFFMISYLNCSSQASLIDSNLIYFPTKMYRNNSIQVGISDSRASWFSKQLIALKEPIIFSDTSKKEMYRFTWLRTFHNPVAIRIEKENNSFELFWKLCSGAGGYDPGELIIDKQKGVDKITWDAFIKLLDQVDYWNLNTLEITDGLDGAEWIIEGKMLNKYQVVDRWTPDKNSRYYKCCDFLISLTDLKIPEKDKY